MNIEELNRIAVATREKQGGKNKRVCVCAGASCMSSGSQAVIDSTKAALKASGLDKEVTVVPVGCMGACNAGPLLKIEEDGSVYRLIPPKASKSSTSISNMAFPSWKSSYLQNPENRLCPRRLIPTSLKNRSRSFWKIAARSIRKK